MLRRLQSKEDEEKNEEEEERERERRRTSLTSNIGVRFAFLRRIARQGRRGMNMASHRVLSRHP